MQKKLEGGLKEWLLIVVCVLLFLAALICPATLALAESLTQEEQLLLDAYRSGELIRLHVIANSDSPQDQAIKLRVRDSVIEVFGQLITDAAEKDSRTVCRVLKQNLPRVQKAAQETALHCGFTGSVKTEFGLLTLPEKQYGQIVLPDGEYQGLRITLGKGEGKNWWCVLFPQLCLALAEANGSDDGKMLYSSQRILTQWLLVSK